MTYFYTSSEGKEFRYYFDITGAELMPGVIDVEFKFNEDVDIVPGTGYISRFFNFNFHKGAIYTTISTVALLGTVQLSLFNVIAVMARFAGESAASYIFGLSLGVVALTAGTVGFSLYNYIAEDNFGALLGFSLGCFLLYTMLSTFITVDARTGFKALGFITNAFKWIYTVQFVTLLASSTLMALFPNSDILSVVLSFVSSIFSIVPSLMATYFAGVSLTVLCAIGNAGKNAGLRLSTGAKFFIKSFEIYKKMILVGAIAGFLLLMTKLGFGIAASFNN